MCFHTKIISESLHENHKNNNVRAANVAWSNSLGNCQSTSKFVHVHLDRSLRETHSETDHVLSHRIVLDVRCITIADCNNDHRQVVAKVMERRPASK
jgi:hypothetical protein